MTLSITAYEIWSDDADSRIVGIRNTQGKICVSSDPGDLLEFMRYSAKQTVRVFWSLDSAIAPVLRLLPKPVLESLSRNDENTEYAGHQLYYLPQRSIRIGRARFYGLETFWSTSEPVPQTLEEVQSKADELSSTLTDCGMSDFTRLVSPISVFAETELGKQTYASIPKGYEIPPSCFVALEYASRCDKREWISAYQLGHWSGDGTEGSQCWDYDLSSCYPSCASDLLNLHEMELWKSDKFTAKEQGAYYGFLRGNLYLDPSAPTIHCSPIITDLERIPGNPAGNLGDDYYLSLDELRLIERNDWGEFKMAGGWFLKPYAGVRPSRPFQSIMDYLYTMRYKSNLANSIAKNTANQIVGKLIETRVDNSYGALRNDIYHSLILSQARCKVSEFLLNNNIQKDELVAVQTDGVRMTRLVPVKGSGMGSWRCNGSQPTILASPYRVYCQDKKPGHLTFDHIVDMVTEHPMSKYYSRTVKHRTTLRQAIQQGDISKVGELDDMPAHLDLVELPREQNRIFSHYPKTGQALISGQYRSTPVIL